VLQQGGCGQPEYTEYVASGSLYFACRARGNAADYFILAKEDNECSPFVACRWEGCISHAKVLQDMTPSTTQNGQDRSCVTHQSKVSEDLETNER
jgi:hypothetical protein